MNLARVSPVSLLLLFTVGQAFAAAGSSDTTSCAALVAAYPRTSCSFDFAKFRTHDPYLDTIEKSGFAGSGLFTGHTYLVRNSQELDAISRRLQPGDQVVLANGEWKDSTIRLNADGVDTHPILVRAQTTGRVVFTGNSSVAFWGSYMVVFGLSFQRGKVDRDNFVVFRLGDGETKPCDNCVADHIAIDNYNSTSDKFDRLKVFYMVLTGRNITVANSSLTNKKNFGTMISADLPAANSGCPPLFASPGGCHQHMLFLKNFVSGFSAGTRGDDGNHKIMQLGWSGISTHSAFSILDGNVFEHAVGENETISIKASDVIVRNNFFRANRGTLNIRSANRALVENNIFDGTSQPSMGGVRIEGAGHWIVHNLFKNLVQPANWYYWPVAVHTATDEDLRDNAEDYARVKNVVIAGNRFEGDATPPIAMGIYPDPSRGRTLLPRDIFVLGNTFSAGAQQPVAGIGSAVGPVYYVGDRALYQGIVERNNTTVH